MAVSLQYPIMEFLSGAVAVTVVLTSGLSVESLFLLTFVLVMLLVAVIDFRHLLIPNKVVLWGLGLVAVLRGIAEPSALLPAFLALAASFSVLLLIRLLGNALLRKQSLGMGDVKLAALIGFVLGLPGLLLALWLAALGGLAFAGSRWLTGPDSGKIPFGSFLAVSSGLLALLQTSGALSLPLAGEPWPFLQ